jgi:hypothetical protein
MQKLKQATGTVRDLFFLKLETAPNPVSLSPSPLIATLLFWGRG